MVRRSRSDEIAGGRVVAGQRPAEVAKQGLCREECPGGETGIEHIVLFHRRQLDLAELGDDMVITGLAQPLLGPEMVHDQTRRHPGVGGDCPNGRPAKAVSGEASQGSVPDAGACGQVFADA